MSAHASNFSLPLFLFPCHFLISFFLFSNFLLITISNRPDYGAADAEISVAPTPALMTPPESVLTPRRILLIDDSLSILKVVSRLLKLNGHTVDTASNGLLGLEKLKSTFESQEYDMVLTDLQMPVMDGIEATDRFRKFESEEIEKRSQSAKGTAGKGKGKAGKRLLIVGMSANSDEQSKKDALETGMDYFFTKPFAYKDLEPILLQHQDQIEQYGTQ
jgi:CheY-like chemotaxis protein